jgi:hypothetical protein
MNAPPTTRLGEDAFLIAYDVDRQRLDGQVASLHDELVAAAVLAELYLHGLLTTDQEGKVRAGERRTGDPILDAVLTTITGSTPRDWKYWVKAQSGTYAAIRDRLAARRVIKVEETKILGIFTKRKVTVRDTRVVRRLAIQTRRAILDGTPIQQVPASTAVLAGLVSELGLKGVLSRREQRANKDRITRLTAQVEPVILAFRAVNAARSSA